MHIRIDDQTFSTKEGIRMLIFENDAERIEIIKVLQSFKPKDGKRGLCFNTKESWAEAADMLIKSVIKEIE